MADPRRRSVVSAIAVVALLALAASPACGQGPRPQGRGPVGGPVKPQASDTFKASVYADNWFVLFVNGKLVAVDPIDFLPHNVVSVDILPEYPMTIAVMAKDNANPATGFEYGNQVGDGGFILKSADGTVTDATWKAKAFFTGPLPGSAAPPQVRTEAIPADWLAVDFDDRAWPQATVFSEADVRPPDAFYQADFRGAQFIWSGDLKLDNTVIFRTRVTRLGWMPRWTTHPDLDISGAPFR
jgi:hypothetical protein